MDNQSAERLISFEAGCTQPVYVTHLEGNLYRLEETPVFGVLRVFLDEVPETQEDGVLLFLGDVIEAETQEDEVLYFHRLVTPSPWHHWDWLLSRDTVESPAFAALKEAIEEQGGKWEQVFGGLFFIHLPQESRFDPDAALQKLS